jgi:hypothetical protein
MGREETLRRVAAIIDYYTLREIVWRKTAQVQTPKLNDK